MRDDAGAAACQLARDPLVDVDMRVLEIADEDAEIVGHAARHVGVQVEHRDDGHVGTGDAPQHLEQVAVGIVGAFRKGRAMAGHEDRVDRQDRLQAGLDLGEVGVADDAAD